MSAITQSINEQFAEQEIYIADADNTAKPVATANDFLFQIRIDNSANTSAVYLKLFDSSVAVTVGSTVPDFQFVCKGESVAEYSIYPGAKINNSLYIACVTQAVSSGATSPTNNVIVRLLTGDADNEV